ncbi:hypothetical protein LX32DRAFT_52936 [Colletotrichum zoysiae]|uniref:Uncharacterized protein n=1 Tax=Colletotrichum zoysiae TaxID=1216348 RepID=A0AAD9LX17_9PEZI|nr:hypothetical protein LX32DRAFT_52936 [Colletotrichum zoysiae]
MRTMDKVSRYCCCCTCRPSQDCRRPLTPPIPCQWLQLTSSPLSAPRQSDTTPVCRRCTSIPLLGTAAPRPASQPACIVQAGPGSQHDRQYTG